MLARSSGTEALAFWICTWRPAFWGHPSNGPRKWVKFGQMTIRMAWLWQEILRYLEIEFSVFRYGLDPRVSGMQRVWRVLASAKNSGTKNWGHNSAQSFPNLGSSKGQKFRLNKNAEYVKAKLSPKHSPHHQLTTTDETLLQLAPTGSPMRWKSAVLAQSSVAKWLSGLQLDILALASHPKLEYTPLTKFRRKFA